MLRPLLIAACALSCGGPRVAQAPAAAPAALTTTPKSAGSSWAFSGPGALPQRAPGPPPIPTDAPLGEGLGFVSADRARVFVQGRVAFEALDLSTGTTQWTTKSLIVPLKVRGDVLIAVSADAEHGRAQLVGLDVGTGKRTFESQPFTFMTLLPTTSVTQLDGSEHLSWTDGGPCGGAWSPQCERSVGRHVLIAAWTGQATSLELQESAPPSECPGQMDLAGVPRAMRSLNPIFAWVDARGCTRPANPFYRNGREMMVAADSNGATFYKSRLTDSGSALDAFPLGKIDRWEITSDDEHLATFSQRPQPGSAHASEQLLRVFTLADGKQAFEGRLAVDTLPVITVVHGQVLYVQVRDAGRELVSVGAYTWTHPVTTPQLRPPLPAAP